MSILTKVALTAAVTVGIGAVIAVVAAKEEKPIEQNGNVVGFKDKQDNIRPAEEDEGVITKIKKFVKKKFIKTLAFVALHMEQFEAIGTLIGLASGIIGIASAVRDYRRGSDMQAQLDRLEKQQEQTMKLIQVETNALGTYQQKCTEVLNDNLKTTDNDIIKFAEKMGVQILEEGEVFSA